jgi:hypothetical protein
MPPLPDLSSLNTDHMADALARLHARHQPLPEALAEEVREAGERTTRQALFQTAERQLGAQEKALSQHAQLTRTLLQQLKSRYGGLVQRVVRLAGYSGGAFKGKFLVGNDTGKTGIFVVKPRFELSCVISPISFELHAGEQKLVSLAFTKLEGKEPLELALDIEAEGRLRARIWVEVSFD